MNQQNSVERIYKFDIPFSFGVYAHWRFPPNHSKMLNTLFQFIHTTRHFAFAPFNPFLWVFRLNLLMEFCYCDNCQWQCISHQVSVTAVNFGWFNGFKEKKGNFYTFIRMKVTRSRIFQISEMSRTKRQAKGNIRKESVSVKLQMKSNLNGTSSPNCISWFSGTFYNFYNTFAESLFLSITEFG